MKQFSSQKPAHSRNKFLHAEQDRKRHEATARQELANKRTPAQQLACLDAFLGVGIGAVRERARLALQKAAPEGVKVKKPSPEVVKAIQSGGASMARKIIVQSIK